MNKQFLFGIGVFAVAVIIFFAIRNAPSQNAQESGSGAQVNVTSPSSEQAQMPQQPTAITDKGKAIPEGKVLTPDEVQKNIVMQEKPTEASKPAPTGLQKEDAVVGTGAEATAGKQVSVQYTGKLTDGTVFDSSYKRNEPFSFTLGSGQVIPGWEQGILGMKVGGKRKLTIPPALAYGPNGVPGAIPPNAVLIFDVELLKVQ